MESSGICRCWQGPAPEQDWCWLCLQLFLYRHAQRQQQAGAKISPASLTTHRPLIHTHTHICLYPHILFIILFGLCYVWILCIPVIAFAWRWNYKIRLIWVNKLALFSISPWYLFICCMAFWLFFFFFNLNLLVSTNHVVCFWLYGCSSQKIRLNCYLFFFQSRRKSASGWQPCWFRGFTTEKLLSRIHHWLYLNTRRVCNEPRWILSHAPWWVAATYVINPTLESRIVTKLKPKWFFGAMKCH